MNGRWVNGQGFLSGLGLPIGRGGRGKEKRVEDLPLDDLQDRMKVVGDLWERGILMTSEPLEAKYDDP